MSSLNLKRAKKKDAELIYKWANDPEVRINAVNKEAIIFENHLGWFNKKVISDETFIFIGYLDEIPVGQIRFDKNITDWQIDYSIDNNHRGKGLGKEIVLEGMKKMKELFKMNLKFTAFVKVNNFASIKVFRNLNYVQLSNSIIEDSEYCNFSISIDN
jgi:UDP-2,4-diacetamido-2,4,6-trideoxy-beta-L-altropyranose hydrolase